MADYTNSRTNSLPDPASPGFRDGDTISLQNGSRFGRQNGRWEPIAFQSGSAESPLTVRQSAQGMVIEGGVPSRAIVQAGMEGGAPTGFFTPTISRLTSGAAVA